MSLRMFDFQCGACTQEFEDLVEADGPAPAICTICGSSDTKRLVTGTRIDPSLGLDSLSWPTMGDKWTRKRAQRRKIEDRTARDHGE